MDFDKLSRRDFLKKTTVLAVGVASVTLFSGLVNAEIYVNLKDCDGLAKTPEYGIPGSSSGPHSMFRKVDPADPNSPLEQYWVCNYRYKCSPGGATCIDTRECAMDVNGHCKEKDLWDTI